jgi:tripartite-type tricarboxylate transporter receptor subunit TctC
MIARPFCAMLVWLALLACAGAQSYPDKPIRVISGPQIGTSGDIVGRLLAAKLTAAMGQPVVFESRPGANGALAANYVKSLSADGYNILFVSSSTVVTGPLLVKNVGFDPLSDFTPITIAAAVPSYLVVNEAVPVDTVPSLIQFAKQNPGKLAYGSVGRGSAFHLIGESLKLAGGIDMLHVPYSGANNANIVGDLLNNRIQVYFPAYPTVLSAKPTGKIKLLAVFQRERVPQLPDLPTVNETVPNNQIVPSWFGFMGPAHLPQSIVMRWQSEVQQALGDPEVSAKLQEIGIIPVGNSASQMANALRTETQDVDRLMKELGVEPN